MQTGYMWKANIASREGAAAKFSQLIKSGLERVADQVDISSSCCRSVSGSDVSSFKVHLRALPSWRGINVSAT